MVGGGSSDTSEYIRVGVRWNDNPSGATHIPFEAILRPFISLVPGIVRRAVPSAALAALSVLGVHSARAQSTTSLLTDAAVLPRHALGVRVLSSWSRFDELLGDGGTRNLAAGFTTDSLSGSQIAQLARTEQLVQTLTGFPTLHLTAGSLVAAANARVVTAPLFLEYGLTRRVSFGSVVPLVETRTTLGARLNPHVGSANVGANPSIAANAWTNNAVLVTSFRDAASALQARLTSCQANPSSPDCAGLLSQQTAAQALVASTGTFADALAELYGTSDVNHGTYFVPISGSAAQQAIDARINNLRAAYQSFGGTVSAGTVRAAGGPAAQNDLNQLLALAGYDSIQSPDHASIGDISIGATYQLVNTYPDDTTRAAAHPFRVALNGTFRLGTGQPANRNRLFDNPTGVGLPGVILGAAIDARLSRRLSGSVIGSYTANFGSLPVSRVANSGDAAFPLTFQSGGTYTPGNVVALAIVPRIRLSGFFSLDGHYALAHTAADRYELPAIAVAPQAPDAIVQSAAVAPWGRAAATAQQVGFGFSYSTIVSPLPSRGAIPFEASFRHLETLSASGGPVPKTVQDQVQLRVFFR
jgi:hypothetical protein